MITQTMMCNSFWKWGIILAPTLVFTIYCSISALVNSKSYTQYFIVCVHIFFLQQWYVNGEIECFSGSHITLAILAILVLIAALLVLLFLVLETKKKWQVVSIIKTVAEFYLAECGLSIFAVSKTIICIPYLILKFSVWYTFHIHVSACHCSFL